MTTSKTQWYYIDDGQEKGPLTSQELARLVHKGIIGKEDARPQIRYGEVRTCCKGERTTLSQGRSTSCNRDHSPNKGAPKRTSTERIASCQA